ncbi:MAG: dienelactone hydrolase family protein [Deltaproteobacteria bacterium]|nr:dienelactone hydrolase family protein [Deltaproteobacteria bacterium]
MADRFRRTLTRLLGRTPARAPLRAKLLERVRLPGIVREKVSYAVEPGERVSAYLFLPEGKGRRPAVLCIHQHHREFHLGKSEPAGLAGDPEQAFALELAGRGYVTLAPDLICFEERQHQMLSGVDYERFEATRQLAGGSCLQAKMLWDLGRALDYLIGRREVDGRRIGCLGHSLGGQEALFLSALDRRIAVGVSSCGFSSYRAIFGAAINHNFAAYVPGLACDGDLDRVLALAAPRPFLVLAGREDPIFPLAGVRATVRGARCAYEQARDRLRLRVFPGGHGFSAPMREAASAWLDRWLRPGGS